MLRVSSPYIPAVASKASASAAAAAFSSSSASKSNLALCFFSSNSFYANVTLVHAASAADLVTEHLEEDVC